MTVVIIAGGNIDIDFTRGFIDDLHESSLFIIACDRGYESCLALGLKPDLVVGDFDSASEGTLERAISSGVDLVRLNPIKDDTDMEAALGVAIERTSPRDKIYLMGGTGTRLDHVMGNIALIGKGILADRAVTMVDSHNLIQMIGAGETLQIKKESQFGKYVSVFPYMEIVNGLTMTGFKYPLSNEKVEGFNTLTVSNELLADIGEISIKTGKLIIMQTKD